MAVPYLSVHARILDAVASHLAAGAAVRAFLGVGDDAAAARARIVEIDGPLVDGQHILLTAPRIRYGRTPGGGYKGTASMGAILCAPAVAGDSDTESHRRALNDLSPIMAWMTRCAWPLVRDIDDQSPIVLDISDGLSGWLASGFDLVLDVVP